MKTVISKNAVDLGRAAAKHAALIINEAIKQKGYARIILSTGASQFETLKALVQSGVDFNKVIMFHLDEYVGLSEEHPASFRKYLKERFTSLVNLKEVHFVNGEGDIRENIKRLSYELTKEPVDLGLIGIGENAHIAFNDPPADFDTKEAYIVVNLDEACKKQQVGEGWFETVNDVPKQAISMSVHRIMQCKAIISAVPHKVKANAVKMTFENELTNLVPATMLKEHPDFTLYVDENSASMLDRSKIMV